MKLLLVLCVAMFAGVVSAQTVNVKDIKTDEIGEEGSSTTIEIKKNKPGTPAAEKKFEITDVSDDIEGEVGATPKEAKANWTKACKDWKAGIKKEHGKDAIGPNCGKMDCTGEVGNKTCTSKATYKLKVSLQ